MLRIGDLLVAGWYVFTWIHDGYLMEQIKVQLFNGITLIMDCDEFMTMVDDEGY